MITLPVLLIIVAAVLLLALVVVALILKRKRGAAVRSGPRTVADLVRQHAERALSAAVEPGPGATIAPPDVPTEEIAPTPVERVVERRAAERWAAERWAAERQAAERRDGAAPVVEPVAAPAPVEMGTAFTEVEPVAPLGDDVPWRRATQMRVDLPAETKPAPAEPLRTPALPLLRRPVGRDAAPRAAARKETAPREAERGGHLAPVRPDEVPTTSTADEPPRRGLAAVPTPVAAPAPKSEEIAVPEPEPVPVDAEPPTRTRRDPAHLAAEHAAADLALLRTFGATDLGSRPDRAPVVALQSAPVPEAAPAAGAPQPVRFRTARRDGAIVDDAAVALLDDRGREASTGRSDAAGSGELDAPHPGAYVLIATAAGHQPGAVALTVTDAPLDADVLLVRSAALVGSVTGEDGPIAGARVTVVQDGEIVEATNTDADGRFRVADLAAGEYAVSVAAAGCEPDVDLVSVADEAEQEHDVDLAAAAVPAG